MNKHAETLCKWRDRVFTDGPMSVDLTDAAAEIERLEAELAKSQDRFRFREAKTERLARELKESRDFSGQAIAMLESIQYGCEQITQAIDLLKIAVSK